MTTIFRDDQWDVLSAHGDRLNRLEQGCPPYIIPPADQLKGGWTHAHLTLDDRYDWWGYRVCDGDLNFQGHLVGGASGTIAYTLPQDYLAVLGGTPTWPTHMVIGGYPPASFAPADIFLDFTTGDLYIYY